MSVCANCAPKRERYSAFPSRFVCIAPRAYLSKSSQEEFNNPMSACANCAPKRGRYNAFLSRFVCIAPRAYLSKSS